MPVPASIPEILILPTSRDCGKNIVKCNSAELRKADVGAAKDAYLDD